MNRTDRYWLSMVAAGVLLLGGCTREATPPGAVIPPPDTTAAAPVPVPTPMPASTRPAEWAQPLTAPGLTNFYKVSADLYRGAQPTAEGFRELEKLGIRTVVSLRELHSDRELIAGTNLKLVSIPTNAALPTRAPYEKFLAVVADPANRPVFVHCQHGADRTGTAVALYRIAVQGWDREAAIREMIEGGYGHHTIFRGLPEFIREFPFDPPAAR